MNAIKLAASWCIGAVLLVGAITYRDDLLPKSDEQPVVAETDRRAVGNPVAHRDNEVSAPRNQSSEDAASSLNGPNRIVRLQAKRNGHFFTPAHINGRIVDVLVDTGATFVALSYEDARTAGLRVGYGDYTHTVSTANGRARVAPVVLNSVAIGDIVIYDVPAVVMEDGAMNGTLLGMSFFRQLRKFEISGNVLTLIE